jgi:hypothetical protein
MATMPSGDEILASFPDPNIEQVLKHKLRNDPGITRLTAAPMYLTRREFAWHALYSQLQNLVGSEDFVPNRSCSDHNPGTN